MAGPHVDAESPVALDAVGGRDLGDDVADPLHHRRKVDLRLLRREAEAVGVADFVRGAGAPDQRFGGDTAGVEAVAAHPVRFDESHLRPHRGGDVGGDESAGPGADHDQVSVIAPRPSPALVDALPSQPVRRELADQREQAEQDERADQARRGDIAWRS
jgi:hypothetical protein